MTNLLRARLCISTHVLMALVFFEGWPICARGTELWQVEGKLLGETKNIGRVTEPDDAKKSKDVSGIACQGIDVPTVCLVVDDESQGAQVIILNDGVLKVGDFIQLIDNSFENAPLELDAEGVTYSKGSFYVIGSHGRPRHAQGKAEDKNVARAAATRQVFKVTLAPDSVDTDTGRLRTPPEIERSTAIAGILKGHPRIAEWFDKALDDNGLTVEGLAATGDEKDGKLYIGMRGPVLTLGTAIILEVPIAAVFGGKTGDVVVHELDLGRDTQGNLRGIRDIVPHMGGFLILAGPVNDPADENYEVQQGDYSVFAWPGSGSDLKGRHDLYGYGVKVKPEAILPIEEAERSFHALLLFDGPDKGSPRHVKIELK